MWELGLVRKMEKKSSLVSLKKIKKNTTNNGQGTMYPLEPSYLTTASSEYSIIAEANY